MIFAKTSATTTEATADTASAASNQHSRGTPRRRTASRPTRATQTATTGSTPIVITIRSPICAQASSSPAAAGTQGRRPVRSSRRKISSKGTPVPVWSGDSSSRNAPGPTCGAIMIPAAISTRTRPSLPVLFPLASRPARTTSSV